MPERKRNTDGWREAVQQAAFGATLKEAQERLGTDDLHFNYRWEHIKVVVRLALRLAELTGADKEIVEAAAWLHDIGKQEKDDDHGRLGALLAGNILAKTDFPAAMIADVVHAIEQHTGLTLEAPIQPLEAAVLWDADKLTKMGVTAVLHNVCYKLCAASMTTDQLLDSVAKKTWHMDAVECFNTEIAQAAGRKRVESYRLFWDQIQSELDGKDLAT